MVAAKKQRPFVTSSSTRAPPKQKNTVPKRNVVQTSVMACRNKMSNVQILFQDTNADEKMRLIALQVALGSCSVVATIFRIIAFASSVENLFE